MEQRPNDPDLPPVANSSSGSEPSPIEPRRFKLIGLGIAIAVVLAAAQFLLALLVPFICFPGLLFSVTQWLYLIPLASRLRRNGQPSYAKGLYLGGGLVMLLHGACYLSLSQGWVRIAG